MIRWNFKEWVSRGNNRRNLIIGVFIAAVVLVIIATQTGCNDGSKVEKGGVELATRIRTQTPAGQTVVSDRVLDQGLLLEADAGAAQAKADAVESGYQYFDSPAVTTIYTPREPCTKSPVQKTWSFKVKAPNYKCHPVYDPDCDGYILAAEMVLQFAPRSEFVVCPNAGVFRDGTRYAKEHILINLNDFNYFIATQTHGPPHPLLPHKGAGAADPVRAGKSGTLIVPVN